MFFIGIYRQLKFDPIIFLNWVERHHLLASPFNTQYASLEMSQTLSKVKNFQGNSQSSKWRDFWKMCATGGLYYGGQLSHICSLLEEFKLLGPVFVLFFLIWIFCSELHLTWVIWGVVWEREKKDMMLEK